MAACEASMISDATPASTDERAESIGLTRSRSFREPEMGVIAGFATGAENANASRSDCGQSNEADMKTLRGFILENMADYIKNSSHEKEMQQSYIICLP